MIEGEQMKGTMEILKRVTSVFLIITFLAINYFIVPIRAVYESDNVVLFVDPKLQKAIIALCRKRSR